MQKPVEVSIFVITYNHVNYIKRCLDSLLSQKTLFSFEILINDDCSDDGTQEIIKDFERKYPLLIKPIYQKENQYSKGISPNIVFNYPRAKGKYIAFCEGDDYWISDNKLQSQYDAMEKNPRCSLSVHDTIKITKEGNILDERFPRISLDEGIITSDRYIHYELVEAPWLFQTSSFFIRRDVFDFYVTECKAFTKYFPVGDKPLILSSLMCGDAYYLKQEFSHYRTDSAGYTSKVKSDFRKKIELDKKFVAGYEAFDSFSNYRYHSDIEYMISRTELNSLFMQGQYRRILKEYHKMLAIEPMSHKIIIYIGCLFPGIVHKLFLALR